MPLQDETSRGQTRGILRSKFSKTVVLGAISANGDLLMKFSFDIAVEHADHYPYHLSIAFYRILITYF